MGCLNSNENFSHWFGNIHFSGPCNRSCYFCIGQHMMALDPYNNLNKWPLDGIDEFIARCIQHNVKEINLTGSNTDPLLYQHIPKLKNYLKTHIPDLVLGCRTNGAAIIMGDGSINPWWYLFDKASISIPTFDHALYKKIMGAGMPPSLPRILDVTRFPLKINIVLCPELLQGYELSNTLTNLRNWGVKRVNLREPYGQPHIGDPMPKMMDAEPRTNRLGMPVYVSEYGGYSLEITYWDVHYVEVESVNLYANGITSVTYPITKGHDDLTGEVRDQTNFHISGRVRDQWVSRGV